MRKWSSLLASRAVLPLLLGLSLIAAAGCGGQRSPNQPTSKTAGQGATAGGTVSVLYAGSLVNLMEHEIGPAFDRTTGFSFQGVGAGSKALANQIKGKLRRADVFISAAPKVNKELMGAANGNWVAWYATFAKAPLVIGYNPQSSFAADLKTKPWYEVMAEPGFRLGRTDPVLDPKGKLTVEFVKAAEAYYHRPDLEQRLLGAADNPAQVFPEEALVGRLQAGQLDAGFFYSNEAAEEHIPVIAPPTALQKQAVYTVAIVRDAPNPQGALAFVRYLLGADGKALLRQHGLTVLSPAVKGDAQDVPAGLRSVLRPASQ